MFNPARAIVSRTASIYNRIVAYLMALVMVFSLSSAMAVAAPGTPGSGAAERAQNVDWMTTDTAISLNIGMDVLVPTWIPEPFSGVAPSVSASSGYYRLYWMIDGASPTFLYIEGIAGGGFPAGSPADLNKELTINASVQGWNAIHDIGIPAGSDTPIYDQVWWIANGVLYTVSSNNMTGTDSLSLANSLIVLSVPQAPEPAPAPTEPPYVPPVEEGPIIETPVNVPQDPGVPVEETGPVDTGSVPVESGNDPVDAPVENVVSDEAAQEAAPVGDSGTTTQAEPDSVGGQSTGPWSPDPEDADLPSDGTSGPPPPVIGSDGTGGLYDNALPRIRFVP